jgi:epoxyqueuosine reductase
MEMKELISGAIERLVAGDARNWSSTLGERYFDTPLVQFASADDPLFTQFKEIIGHWHLTPREVFEAVHGDGSWRGGTVVSWVVPWSQNLRDSNRDQKERPSREVTEAYHLGYQVLQKEVRAALLELVAGYGVRGVAPVDGSGFRMVDTPTGKSSTWSDRHAAYAAGLGTFGLSRGFISERGSAVALSSLVIDAVLEPDQRSKGHLDNCLYFANGSCGACRGRCPAGAISREGQDKNLCARYAYGPESIALAASHGLRGPAGCALCQVRVPCEARNPVGPKHWQAKAALCGREMSGTLPLDA